MSVYVLTLDDSSTRTALKVGYYLSLGDAKNDVFRLLDDVKTHPPAGFDNSFVRIVSFPVGLRSAMEHSRLRKVWAYEGGHRWKRTQHERFVASTQ